MLSVALGAFVASADCVYGGTTGLDVWTQHRPMPDVPPLLDVAFGNDRFVAVGEGGTVLTSTNGLTWVRSETGQTGTTYTMVFGGGLFVGLGACHHGACWRPDLGPRPHALVSPDGISWTNVFIDRQLGSPAYGNGVFVAAGGERILTSPDGLAWTERLQTPGASSIAFGNNRFVATGYSFESPRVFRSFVMSSTDGISWTNPMPLPEVTAVWSIVFANGSFTAVGGGGEDPFSPASSLILRSADGSNWSVSEPRGLFVPFSPFVPTLSYADGSYYLGMEASVGGHGFFRSLKCFSLNVSNLNLRWTAWAASQRSITRNSSPRRCLRNSAASRPKTSPVR